MKVPGQLNIFKWVITLMVYIHQTYCNILKFCWEGKNVRPPFKKGLKGDN